MRHKKIIFGHATTEVIHLVRRILLSSILVLFSFNLFTVSAQSITNIEILDIEKNKIIKTTKKNPKAQQETEKIIKEIEQNMRPNFFHESAPFVIYFLSSSHLHILYLRQRSDIPILLLNILQLNDNLFLGLLSDFPINVHLPLHHF